LIETLPSLINASQARRDPNPAAARKRFSRISMREPLAPTKELKPRAGLPTYRGRDHSSGFVLGKPITL
jgi:hypothetical protein